MTKKSTKHAPKTNKPKTPKNTVIGHVYFSQLNANQYSLLNTETSILNLEIHKATMPFRIN